MSCRCSIRFAHTLLSGFGFRVLIFACSFIPPFLRSRPSRSWSECAVDDNDDDGENRDGDENWYQQRTQQFCANAAYSLYGIPKHHVSVFHCSRAHYIDSFFTYGGADTLIDAIGKTPTVYFDDDVVDDDDDDDGNYGDDDGSNNYNVYKQKSINAQCHILSYGDDNRALNEQGEQGGEGSFEAELFSHNNIQNNENEQRQLSGSGDYDYLSGYSTTMGCDAKGNFAVAKFEGQTCDGNYFLEITQKAWKYNSETNYRCHNIYKKAWSDHGYNSTVFKLLSESWSCDIDLYPNGCPDPYGKKKLIANALHAVSTGQNPSMAILNGRLKNPLRFTSFIFMVVGIGLIVLVFCIRNKERQKAHGGGMRGWVRVLRENYEKHKRNRAIPSEVKKDKKKKKKKRKKSRSRSRSKSRIDEEADTPATTSGVMS